MLLPLRDIIVQNSFKLVLNFYFLVLEMKKKFSFTLEINFSIAVNIKFVYLMKENFLIDFISVLV